MGPRRAPGTPSQHFFERCSWCSLHRRGPLPRMPRHTTAQHRHGTAGGCTVHGVGFAVFPSRSERPRSRAPGRTRDIAFLPELTHAILDAIFQFGPRRVAPKTTVPGAASKPYLTQCPAGMRGHDAFAHGSGRGRNRFLTGGIPARPGASPAARTSPRAQGTGLRYALARASAYSFQR